MSPIPSTPVDGDQSVIPKKDIDINDFVFDFSLMMKKVNSLLMDYGKIQADINKD